MLWMAHLPKGEQPSFVSGNLRTRPPDDFPRSLAKMISCWVVLILIGTLGPRLHPAPSTSLGVVALIVAIAMFALIFRTLLDLSAWRVVMIENQVLIYALRRNGYVLKGTVGKQDVLMWPYNSGEVSIPLGEKTVTLYETKRSRGTIGKLKMAINVSVDER